LKAGFDNAHMADLCLVLGSSLTVIPAADMPKTVAKNGKLVIVNSQKTPLDSKAALRVFAKTDDFMSQVMKYLGISLPEWRLQRRLHVTTSYEEKTNLCSVTLQGIDFDETPVSFIKSISCTNADTGAKVLSKEPFVHTFQPKTSADTKLDLEFMGHYLEPNLEFVHKPAQPNECKLYTLEYNPFQRSWNVTAKDAKPMEFTYIRIQIEV
jgi:mono-ADP-ribosyltransferase sirtuin 6